MIVTTLDDWLTWSQSYNMLPYVQRFPLLPAEDKVLSWEEAWEAASEYSFVLESGKMGRYSFLGLHPLSTFSGKGNEGLSTHIQSAESTKHYGAPMTLIKEWMEPYRSPKVSKAPKFIGGCVGYWGYDVVRSLERIPVIADDDLLMKDYYFMMINELWIVDHEEQALYCATHSNLDGVTTSETLANAYEDAGNHVSRMKQFWDSFTSHDENIEAMKRKDKFTNDVQQDKLSIDVESLQGIQTAFPKASYIDAVKRIHQYIAQGDVFQVNLSIRQSKKLQSSPEEIYEWLRLFNPSPYMSFLRFPKFKIVSASPELLVKLEGQQVSARPIAGTRNRGVNDQDDQSVAEELLLNEKERAEHIMLLDLERNDLGRISKYGSVHVSEFMVVEYYSHVMHIVSEVQGQLKEELDAFDVMAATFPGGTITGAPKIRTMEIIEELEPVRRGLYTGSIGWIDYNGNMEFNIVIRTLLIKDDIGYIQAGAGIVIDSDPLQEYNESLSKAKALWKAIQFSEQIKEQVGR